MIVPPFVEKNDLVGLISPSGRIDPQVVSQAESFLNNSGFRFIRGRHVLEPYHQFGATDQQRAGDLHEMIRNPEVKVIWCTRGGYGAIRLLNLVDFSILKRNPKWLVGFSDITVFHSVLQNVYEVGSIHGAMPKNLTTENFEMTDIHALWEMLQGVMPDYQLSSHPLNRSGNSDGFLTGGNISLLYALKGSQYDFNPNGKILFLEETGEYLYHLDRMMQGLKVSGKLAGLSGLVVGQMTDMRDGDISFGTSAFEIIAEAVKDYDYPVIFNFPAGHGLRNQPLMMGAKIQMEVNHHKVSVMYDVGFRISDI